MKRILSAVISLAVMIAALPPVMAAEPTQPEIEIVGSTVKGDNNFFELGLRITPGDEGFMSAGVALEYDRDVIVPISWDKTGTEVTMTGTKDWKNVASLPALCPTQISGKTAFAYNNQTDETKGYLYLGAEAPLNMTAEQAQNLSDDRFITVRFGYVGADADAKAASKAKITKIVNTDPANPVTAFENGDIVALAPDAVAADSPAGQQTVYCTGAKKTDESNVTDEVVEYYYSDNVNTEGLTFDTKLAQAPVFTLNEIDKSSNSGGGSKDDYAPVVFFDWDEKTLLGSLIIEKGTDAEIKRQIAEYTEKMLLPSGTEFEDMTTWDDTKAKACTVYDTTAPLTSHDGYTFGKWIDFNSEAYTVYGNTPLADSLSTTEDIPAPEGIDYATADLSKGLILKAAYIANTKMDIYTQNSQKYYTVEIDDAFDSGYYGRFGESNTYSIRYKVTRKNNEGQPVPRPRKSGLRVTYNMDAAKSTQIYSLVNMDNVDEQVVEVAVPSNVYNVAVEVIDLGETSAWATGAAGRFTPFEQSPGIDASTGKVTDETGFVFKGTLYYINQAIAEQNVTIIGKRVFDDVNITVGIPAPIRMQAVTKIRTAQGEKFEATGKRYLTREEMVTAISTGHYSPES